jgi:hypothetical protein
MKHAVQDISTSNVDATLSNHSLTIQAANLDASVGNNNMHVNSADHSSNQEANATDVLVVIASSEVSEQSNNIDATTTNQTTSQNSDITVNLPVLSSSEAITNSSDAELTSKAPKTLADKYTLEILNDSLVTQNGGLVHTWINVYENETLIHCYSYGPTTMGKGAIAMWTDVKGTWHQEDHRGADTILSAEISYDQMNNLDNAFQDVVKQGNHIYKAQPNKPLELQYAQNCTSMTVYLLNSIGITEYNNVSNPGIKMPFVDHYIGEKAFVTGLNWSKVGAGIGIALGVTIGVSIGFPAITAATSIVSFLLAAGSLVGYTAGYTALGTLGGFLAGIIYGDFVYDDNQDNMHTQMLKLDLFTQSKLLAGAYLDHAKNNVVSKTLVSALKILARK